MSFRLPFWRSVYCCPDQVIFVLNLWRYTRECMPLLFVLSRTWIKWLDHFTIRAVVTFFIGLAICFCTKSATTVINIMLLRYCVNFASWLLIYLNGLQFLDCRPFQILLGNLLATFYDFKQLFFVREQLFGTELTRFGNVWAILKQNAK